MSKQETTLFIPVVTPEKLNSNFKRLMDDPSYHPGRQMLAYIYQDFIDLDGNFLEQFQTTGFDARFFELYLFAYFTKSGFEVEQVYQSPDFMVTRDGLTVAVEATTVNPSEGEHSKRNTLLSELSPEEFEHYLENHLPIKFGGPLFSKLKLEYWELEHCKGKPFVLAIEAFFNEEALGFSDSAISQYLYGQRQSADWSKDGVLEVQAENIDSHTSGTKTIPSNFFEQPGTEHISAVIFTNSGTLPKFSRMGYQQGFGTDHFEIHRRGLCYTRDPNAKDPSYFAYSLAQPPLVEGWGQGLVVHHNPNALFPLPRDYFPDAMQVYVEDGRRTSDVPDWHPFVSTTFMFHFETSKSWAMTGPRVYVMPITQDEFRSKFPFDTDIMGITTEVGWFTDESESFLGVIVEDKTDHDWVYVILARDEQFLFRVIDTAHSYPSREIARRELQFAMAKLVMEGQRIFPQ